MPNNISITGFDEKEDERRVNDGIKKAKEFSLSLINGTAKWLPENCGNCFVSWLTRNTSLPWIAMRRLYTYSVEKDKCNQYEICVKLCPVKNIKMDEYPCYLKHCELCLRCISYCPQNAISFKGKKKFAVRKNIMELPNVL